MPRGVLSKDGDTHVSANGYHYRRVNGKWRAEHHLIAEQKLGRPLRENEMARFIDGDRNNLSPDNIEVVVKKLSLDGRIATLEAKIMELQAERDKLIAQKKNLARARS